MLKIFTELPFHPRKSGEGRQLKTAKENMQERVKHTETALDIANHR
jgi:hypothetical protein